MIRTIPELQKEKEQVEKLLLDMGVIDTDEFQSFWVEFCRSLTSIMPEINKNSLGISSEDHAFINGMNVVNRWAMLAPEQIKRNIKKRSDKIQDALYRLYAELKEKEEISIEP